MMNAVRAWIWSLKVVARSYRAVVVLAALIALWVYAAYAWLGLAESSGLLLILALLWAIVQVVVTVGVAGGIARGAARTVAAEGESFAIRSLWSLGWRKLGAALLYSLLCTILVWLCSALFGWINAHSVEVASFLTFHSQKAISHVPIEEIYSFIEGLLWVAISGFLVSFLLALMSDDWRGAAKQSGKLLAACAFRAPFVSTLLSAVVFGGGAYELANWHPAVPSGFWDYTQMIARLSLVLVLIASGMMFWTLSLARQQLPKQDSPLG